MPWIDSHCHLDAPELEPDIVSVRALARERGVTHCVIPAVDAHNLDAVRQLAHALGDSYALGIHPLCSNDATGDHLDRLAGQLQQHRDDPRLVAVGKIGLDYFVDNLDDQHQQHIYREQLKLAHEHGLPVIVHSRRSVDKVLKHLREIEVPGGIAHAFTGSLQQAESFLKLGFKLGFGGASTFERATRLHGLLRELPLSAIVVETDSPDIPPHWVYRTAAERQAGASQGRNTPAELPRIAECIADVRGIDPQELAVAAMENTMAALPGLRRILDR